jgi:hypothetical protein
VDLRGIEGKRKLRVFRDAVLKRREISRRLRGARDEAESLDHHG